MNKEMKDIYTYLIRPNRSRRHEYTPIHQIVTYCQDGWVGGFRYTIAQLAYPGRKKS